MKYPSWQAYYRVFTVTGLVFCLFFSSSLDALDFHTLWHHLWQKPTPPLWQAAQAYHQGNYSTAEKIYRTHQDETSLYNLGNTLAKRHQYQAAIDAYRSVLAQHPNHEDATFNKALVEKLLHAQQQKNPSTKQKDHPSPPNSNESHATQGEPSHNQLNDRRSQQQHDRDTPATQQSKDKEPQEKTEPAPPQKANPEKTQPKQATTSQATAEEKQAKEQWLRLVPDHPGGLLRQQFLRDYLRRHRRDES